MRIAVFTKNRSNPAYEAARIGADRAAAAHAGVRIEHHVPETPDDAGQQEALVRHALATRPDALVFTPVHPTRLEGALDAVQAAGIPVFGFVNRMPPGRCVSYVGASDTALAERIAARLFEHLAKPDGEHVDVVMVTGPEDSVTSLERMRAFEATAARHPHVRLVGRCNGAYQREPAREAFAALLPRHARIDGVLAANDIMAIGVLEALQAAGRTAAVVGVNAIPQAVAAIRAGTMLATADFNAMAMCHLATACAIRHLQGQPVPAEIELPVGLVDRHNAHLWDLPYAQRPLPGLDEVAGR